jgi:hypothetical protein
VAQPRPLPDGVLRDATVAGQQLSSVLRLHCQDRVRSVEQHAGPLHARVRVRAVVAVRERLASAVRPVGVLASAVHQPRSVPQHVRKRSDSRRRPNRHSGLCEARHEQLHVIDITTEECQGTASALWLSVVKAYKTKTEDRQHCTSGGPCCCLKCAVGAANKWSNDPN